MLLNEFLKEHRKVESQSCEIAELKTAVSELRAAMQDQAAQMQKMSGQFAASQTPPR
jgi:uncharacterized coiled-coil protein SlyX